MFEEAVYFFANESIQIYSFEPWEIAISFYVSNRAKYRLVLLLLLLFCFCGST